MNKIHIDKLLEKYWDAETSIDEENELRDYFSSQAIDKTHRSYVDLFRHYKVSSQISVSDHVTLSEDIIAAHSTDHNFVHKVKPFMKYAAAIFILMISYSLFLKLSNRQFTAKNTLYAGKYTELNDSEDYDEAYAITIEALSYLKTKINMTENEVVSPLIPIGKAINKIKY